ncbi:hypothetical protein [Paenibacillus lautus]|uniref:hypothetical protein n=1 Tax=Paenibacillus lautus TaxID=1401 RepID=UPI001FE4AC1F|nr:hypothetical protein [Paenibacillus lautus]
MIEHITSVKVYTLLLNVDYVPVLKELKLPELIEFALHLVISVLLSIALAIFLKQKNWSRERGLSWVSLVWLAGHLLYGIALGWLLTGSREASA